MPVPQAATPEMANVTDRPVSIEELLKPEDESTSGEAATNEAAATTEKPKRKSRKKAE